MTTFRDDAHRQLTAGIFIIVIGVLFLFDQTSIFSFSRAVHVLWPVVLIWIGVSKLMRRTSNRPMPGGDQTNAQ